MGISLIWAMAENGVIGRNNSLPWRLPVDMKHFMTTTMGKPVVMGRKTLESMKSPLPGRTNIVLTRDPDWQREGVHVVGDLAAALELAEQQSLIDGTDETMIIGGAEIYAQALPLADRLYVTRVHDSPLGDVYFPPVEFADWRLLSQQQHEADERHSAPCTIEVYER
ncbi:MAG: dihydrofolate reductase [Pseudomonadota bacterium]|nr:dihydrofolate reductase [Pseudomonadota bacterium]MEC7138021.1 dihydrofolate reductase [Pseudomonadota bacterium]MEC7250379.1 dihydrofolate reductase [Pseudomonadota bacterium]MEC7414247.1 dihydrofolate reductase [Pseudomonadota bacterium]MEC7419153.1 dihydrofolate reductase [Pseudomonadota bacterium]